VSQAVLREAPRPLRATAQFTEVERLDEVVVGARVRAVDALFDAGARGQHQDRRPNAVAAKARAGPYPLIPGRPMSRMTTIEGRDSR
jgi:hypothetical protein